METMIDLYKNLKPCPFCGSENIYVTFEHGYIDDSAVVFCNICKVSVKLEDNDQEGFNDRTARMAVDAWNKRVYESVDERKEIPKLKLASLYGKCVSDAEE